MPELTVFAKANGVLSKRISLNGDGTVKSDGAECAMARGRARRATVPDVAELAKLIESLKTNEAISLGMLKPGLPNDVAINVKAKVAEINQPDIVARTADNIVFEAGQSAFCLFDLDVKAMPPEVKRRIADRGGYWGALVAVLPGLADATHAVRPSTSAGLRRIDTGQQFPASGGTHCYVQVINGADVDRFLRTAHDRAWLAGFGWMMLDAAGRPLERSIVDRLIGQPERLIFEAQPVVEEPLVQDLAARRPVVTAGAIVDTLAVCPPLTVVEKDQLQRLKAQERQRLAPSMFKAREEYIKARVDAFARRTGMSRDAAKRTLEKQCDNVLWPDVELEFDDGSVIKVAVVLDNPAMYDGDTLSDPIEGPAYGRGKAKVMRGADGDVIIHSFAHGNLVYRLRYDTRAVRARIATPCENPVERFIGLMLLADLDGADEDDLIDEVKRITGARVNTIKAKLKEARSERAERRAEAARERRRAARADPRPQVDRPARDAPLIPVLEAVNAEVTAAPPRSQMLRDPDGDGARRHRLAVPPVQPYTNEEDDADD